MSYRESKIQLLKQRLRKVEKAIDEVIENGVSYSLNGSHSVTMADLDKLRAMESSITFRLASLYGVRINRRTVADFDARGGRN